MKPYIALFTILTFLSIGCASKQNTTPEASSASDNLTNMERFR